GHDDFVRFACDPSSTSGARSIAPPSWAETCQASRASRSNRHSLSGMRSRLSRRALLVVLALGVAQFAAGCGGSSRLSEAAYRTQLAAINRDVSNAAGAARGAIVPNSSVQQIRSALQAFAVVQQR